MAEKAVKKDEQKLAAVVRTEFGKGSARRARRANQIPAVIYGHGAAPIHIALPERQTTRAVRGANALLTLDIQGDVHLALVKDIQRDPLLQIIEHIDLLTVRKGEKVIVDVPVVLIGEVAPGAVTNQEEVTISLEAEATNLPKHVEVDIAGREVGAHIYAADLVLPAGSVLLADPELLIVNISEPEEQDLGEETEAPAADAPAAE
ncbi:MAG: 50S ribosomal protein L25/general stress protein Ctc [Actinomycetota bacterium]|uniref:50S ribosomal protein L25/general stress protein Ctc n=1 Tax=Arthrobacter sp. A5 TaxID=576926 RepID=UPI0027F42932|nr:50S ribosomal protein L25/general stress protein Ctc [Actinomycetota bacterium]